MRIVRSVQIASLEEDRRQFAVRRLLEELARSFPADVALLDASEERALVELAIERAERHELTTLGECWRFLTLVVMFGAGFDVDPQLPWAAVALERPGAAPAVRMNSAVDAASEYLAVVSGAKGERYRRALARARRLRVSDLTGAISVPAAAGVDGFLRRLHPEKHALLGRAVVERLASDAHDGAQRLGIGIPEGQLLVATLMFLLGAGFESDPAHRWVTRALARRDTPITRCEEVLEAARERIERAFGREPGQE